MCTGLSGSEWEPLLGCLKTVMDFMFPRYREYLLHLKHGNLGA